MYICILCPDFQQNSWSPQLNVCLHNAYSPIFLNVSRGCFANRCPCCHCFSDEWCGPLSFLNMTFLRPPPVYRYNSSAYITDSLLLWPLAISLPYFIFYPPLSEEDECTCFCEMISQLILTSIPEWRK